MSEAVPALVCRRLRLRQFRNFPELELEVPRAGVAIIGDNGSGKTNLLESLYYLEIFRSFRGSPDEQIVRFGGEAFHIRGEFEDTANGDVLEITAAFETKTRTKRVTVNGAEPERLGDAIGRVRVVIFSPGDLSIVAGGPAERRRFLDIVLSVNVPGYLPALQRYRQALRQRNAVLRSGGSGALLSAWDGAFLDAGARIACERAQWIAGQAPGFARRYCAVGDGAVARLAYRPGFRTGEGAATTLEALRAALAADAERAAQRERERGMTLAGPHRDDVAILTSTAEGDVDLRDYGSGGQLRTAAMALRMIEAESARTARGSAPLVLLDNVFAELDAGRSRRILEMLETEGHGQVILTAPKESDIQLRAVRGAIASLPRLAIRAGQVSVFA